MESSNRLGRLFLIPSPIAPDSLSDTLTPDGLKSILHITHFAVENIRTARRFLAQLPLQHEISTLQFQEIGKRGQHHDLQILLKPLQSGLDLGVISEAGLPCIADPGAALTTLAHELGAEIVPLVGPSSILLALMASGLNGQSFAFNGYLPIEQSARRDRIKLLERIALQTGQTQLFIETPYRNQQLYTALVATLAPSTRLCIAHGLQHPEQSIRTQAVKQWKQEKVTLQKIPTIFAFGA